VEENSTNVFDFDIAAGAVSGIVSDSNNNPIASALVEVKRLNDMVMYNVDSNFIPDGITDSNGSYNIDNILAGDCLVTVKASGYVSKILYPVEVSGSKTTAGQNLSLPVGGKISGTITDSSNNAIAGAVISAQHDHPDMFFNSNIKAVSDAQGNYLVDYLKQGTYTLDISSDNYVAATSGGITVTAGQTTTNQNFLLSTTGGSITGTIYDESGNPLEEAIIACVNYETFVSCTTETDANGEYSINLLGPGSYLLAIVKIGYSDEQIWGVTITGTEVSSGNDAIMELE